MAGIKQIKPLVNNGFTKVSDTHYKIPSVANTAGRAGAITVESLIVQAVAGSNTEVDGAVTADTTGTPSRKILGVCCGVNDKIGRYLADNYRATTEEGICTLIPARDNVFVAEEDADGGRISDANANGTYASLVISPITNFGSEETEYPNPDANIKIDSSSIASGTSGNRAIKLLGLETTVQNAVATGPRRFRFTFTDAFTEPIG